jgi:hypothetical protein
MDGAFYNDLKEPHISVDPAAVTLATTLKALYPAGNFPNLGGQYFARPGKKLKIRAFGRITTVLTPGNLVLSLLYGNGTDANGVTICSSAAIALIASQTNLSWMAEFAVHCRSIGSTGTLFGTGYAKFNPAVIASTNQPILIPASAPAVSASCDLTAALGLSLQASRSGSTAETMQLHDLEVIAMN